MTANMSSGIDSLAFLATFDDDIRAVSAITHTHWMSTEACVTLVRILTDLIDGKCIEDAIATNVPDSKTFAYRRELEDLPREQVRSGGFVLDTLGAAFWCALHTESYKDCVLAAVNLGDDSGTTACVAGAIARAIYGYEDIPSEWVGTLSGADLIIGCLFMLLEV